MAFRFKYIGEKTHQTFYLYNVDWAVGRIGGNVREDVMLVQVLLRIVFYELAGKGGLTPPPGNDGIAVDGYYGPVTQRHITQFQDEAAARSQNIKRDGIFDPFRKQGSLSHISHTRYSMELLNNFCSNLCDQNHMKNFDDMLLRDDIPTQLRNALKTVKTTAAQYR